MRSVRWRMSALQPRCTAQTSPSRLRGAPTEASVTQGASWPERPRWDSRVVAPRGIGVVSGVFSRVQRPPKAVRRSAAFGTGRTASSHCTSTAASPVLVSSWSSSTSPPAPISIRVRRVRPSLAAVTSARASPVRSTVEVQRGYSGTPPEVASRPGRPDQPSESCGTSGSRQAASRVPGGVWRLVARSSPARSAASRGPRSRPQWTTAGRPEAGPARMRDTPSRRRVVQVSVFTVLLLGWRRAARGRSAWRAARAALRRGRRRSRCWRRGAPGGG